MGTPWLRGAALGRAGLEIPMGLLAAVAWVGGIGGNIVGAARGCGENGLPAREDG